MEETLESRPNERIKTNVHGPHCKLSRSLGKAKTHGLHQASPTTARDGGVIERAWLLWIPRFVSGALRPIMYSLNVSLYITGSDPEELRKFPSFSTILS